MGNKILQENHKKHQLLESYGWNFYDPARKKTRNNSFQLGILKTQVWGLDFQKCLNELRG